MKTPIPNLAIASILFSLFSCNIAKNITELPKTLAISTSPVANLSSNNCFIQFKDGTVKQYSSLKLVTGVFQAPHLIADENITVSTDEIKAYQDKKIFAISQKEFTNVTQSHVATDALPGFAVRIITGKLNVYSLRYYNGHNNTEKLFLQAGEDGQILPATPNLLNELVKDNSEAVAILHKNYKELAATKKLLAVVDVYNNTSKLISKN
jgi:hypothetical protein